MEKQREKERQRLTGGAGLNTARPNKEGRKRDERGLEHEKDTGECPADSAGPIESAGARGS